MATLRLITVCTYLTQIEGVTWRQKDWAGNKMVKILKGEPIKGFFAISDSGVARRFDQGTAANFRPIAHQMLGKAIGELAPLGATLVPIPNSQVTSPSTQNFRTRILAEGVAATNAQRLKSDPALVFATPQPKSSKGGSRDPEYLESMMRLDHVPTGQVVLVDDVTTTGAHFIAGARKLRAVGVPVIAAVAFAKSTKEQAEKVLKVVEYELELDAEPFDLSEFF
jgi:hypothetical protein